MNLHIFEFTWIHMNSCEYMWINVNLCGFIWIQTMVFECTSIRIYVSFSFFWSKDLLWIYTNLHKFLSNSFENMTSWYPIDNVSLELQRSFNWSTAHISLKKASKGFISKALQNWNRIDEEIHVIISNAPAWRESAKDLLRTHGPVWSRRHDDNMTKPQTSKL